MTIADYEEAFSILAKYDEPNKGPQPVYPSHEKLEIYVDPEKVSDEDIQRLEELRFYEDPDGLPEPHFYVFT